MTNSSEFDFHAALGLLESTDSYPVDFELVWQWLGYQRKAYAKETLVRNFERDLDYTFEFCGLNRKNPLGGRPSNSIKLSLDCFKSFCMMAGTEKGKEVRRYFLQCERQLRQILSEPLTEPFSLEHRIEARFSRRFTGIEERLERLEAAMYSKRSNRVSRPKSRFILEPIEIVPPTDQEYSCNQSISRRQQILNYLYQHRGVRFYAEELSQLLQISAATIRKELPIMHRIGLIDREFNPEYIHRGKGVSKYFYLVENVL